MHRYPNLPKEMLESDLRVVLAVLEYWLMCTRVLQSCGTQPVLRGQFRQSPLPYRGLNKGPRPLFAAA